MTSMKTRLASAGMLGLVLIGWTGSTPRAEGPRSDERSALHVLNRITFGPRAGDVARVQAEGIQRFIDLQLHPERLADTDFNARLADFETLGLDSRTLAQRYELPAVQERLARQQNAGTAPTVSAAPTAPSPVQQRGNLPLVELSEQKLLRAVYSERQLEAVLTDFWFNHFNVDARKGPERFMLTAYERDVIRPHVLGHFRDLLGATAKSPAMLFYLDNWMSADPNGPHLDRAAPDARARVARIRGQANGPVFPLRRPGAAADAPAPPQRPTGLNENYGRELLELHTLGVDGGYTQADVTEVARAFTGWTIQNPRLGGGYRFAPALHDDGEKVVLGHRIKAGGGERDGEQVLDIVAAHPATARFIARKLARRFVSDTPPDALVERLATTFRRTDGDLREVMRTLLLSPEFLSGQSDGAKVKNPFEFFVSALRATGVEVADARPAVRSLQELGMPLYQCQPPTGYADRADAWVNTGALVNRMNVALALANGQLRGISLPSPAGPPSLPGSGASEATRATIARAQSPAQAMALALGSPEFQRR